MARTLPTTPRLYLEGYESPITDYLSSSEEESDTDNLQLQNVTENSLRKATRLLVSYKSPEESPNKSPEESPNKSPEESPNKSPEASPNKSPEESPNKRLEKPFRRPLGEPLERSLEEPVSKPLEDPHKIQLGGPLRKPVEESPDRLVETSLGRALEELHIRPLQNLLCRPLGESLGRSLEESYSRQLEEPHKRTLEEPHERALEETHKRPLWKPHRRPLEEPHKRQLEEPYIRPLEEPHKRALEMPPIGLLEKLHVRPLEEPHSRPLEGAFGKLPEDEHFNKSTDQLLICENLENVDPNIPALENKILQKKRLLSHSSSQGTSEENDSKKKIKRRRKKSKKDVKPVEPPVFPVHVIFIRYDKEGEMIVKSYTYPSNVKPSKRKLPSSASENESAAKKQSKEIWENSSMLKKQAISFENNALRYDEPSALKIKSDESCMSCDDQSSTFAKDVQVNVEKESVKNVSKIFVSDRLSLEVAAITSTNEYSKNDLIKFLPQKVSKNRKLQYQAISEDSSNLPSDDNAVDVLKPYFLSNEFVRPYKSFDHVSKKSSDSTSPEEGPSTLARQLSKNSLKKCVPQKDAKNDQFHYKVGSEDSSNLSADDEADDVQKPYIHSNAFMRRCKSLDSLSRESSDTKSPREGSSTSAVKLTKNVLKKCLSQPVAKSGKFQYKVGCEDSNNLSADDEADDVQKSYFLSNAFVRRCKSLDHISKERSDSTSPGEGTSASALQPTKNNLIPFKNRIDRKKKLDQEKGREDPHYPIKIERLRKMMKEVLPNTKAQIIKKLRKKKHKHTPKKISKKKSSDPNTDINSINPVTRTVHKNENSSDMPSESDELSDNTIKNESNEETSEDDRCVPESTPTKTTEKKSSNSIASGSCINTELKKTYKNESKILSTEQSSDKTLRNIYDEKSFEKAQCSKQNSKDKMIVHGNELHEVSSSNICDTEHPRREALGHVVGMYARGHPWRKRVFAWVRSVYPDLIESSSDSSGSESDADDDDDGDSESDDDDSESDDGESEQETCDPKPYPRSKHIKPDPVPHCSTHDIVLDTPPESDIETDDPESDLLTENPEPPKVDLTNMRPNEYLLDRAENTLDVGAEISVAEVELVDLTSMQPNEYYLDTAENTLEVGVEISVANEEIVDLTHVQPNEYYLDRAENTLQERVDTSVANQEIVDLVNVYLNDYYLDRAENTLEEGVDASAPDVELVDEANDQFYGHEPQDLHSPTNLSADDEFSETEKNP